MALWMLGLRTERVLPVSDCATAARMYLRCNAPDGPCDTLQSFFFLFVDERPRTTTLRQSRRSTGQTLECGVSRGLVSHQTADGHRWKSLDAHHGRSHPCGYQLLHICELQKMVTRTSRTSSWGRATAGDRGCSWSVSTSNELLLPYN